MDIRVRDRSGPQTSVTKLSKWWPLGEAILAVAQLRLFFFIFNPLLSKLVF